MTIERRTVVDQVEIRPDGLLQIRFAKQLVESGEVIASEWHRAILEPGAAPEERMKAVNAHLAQMGCAQVIDHSMLSKAAAAFHTPEAISAYRDAQERDRARAEKLREAS